MTTPVSLVTAALDTLHGARSLPPEEAIAELRDFLEEASAALMILVSQLEREGRLTMNGNMQLNDAQPHGAT
jgi:hypothetical protein